jgi:predicted RNA-binding protein with TRAM domain
VCENDAPAKTRMRAKRAQKECCFRFLDPCANTRLCVVGVLGFAFVLSVDDATRALTHASAPRVRRQGLPEEVACVHARVRVCVCVWEEETKSIKRGEQQVVRVCVCGSGGDGDGEKAERCVTSVMRKKAVSGGRCYSKRRLEKRWVGKEKDSWRVGEV